jgi:hypothetical protein
MFNDILNLMIHGDLPSTQENPMSDAKNPRFNAELLGALSAVSAPINKILAIGSVNARGTPEMVAPILPFEVRATVRNYLAGKIDHWFFQAEGNGVVFIMNASSRQEAHEILEKLPLGVAGLMDFELIALSPLKPLALLLGDQ